MLLSFNSSLKGCQTPYQPSMPMKMSLRVYTQKVGIRFKALLSYESVHGLPPPATSPLTPPPASPTLLQLLWTPSSRLAPHAGSLLLPLVQTAPFASNTPTPNPMPSSEQFLPVFQISGKVSSLLKKSPLGVPTR